MSEIHISVQGFEKIKKELEALKKERPAVIQAIKEAREEGDLKENAGYDAAREGQGMLEARISHIESRLPRFQIIDLNTMGGDKVAFGATVEIENMESGERKTYTLLGPDEADFNKGTISVYSPLARAILGQEEGAAIEVDAPRGRIFYEIISIEFNGAQDR